MRLNRKRDIYSRQMWKAVKLYKSQSLFLVLKVNYIEIFNLLKSAPFDFFKLKRFFRI